MKKSRPLKLRPKRNAAPPPPSLSSLPVETVRAVTARLNVVPQGIQGTPQRTPEKTP